MKSPEFKLPIRIVTAASLFDGHDATINIIRRMLQDAGAEVIHLGHNQSVMDIIAAALQEGAQGICISSYQGGHLEFFKYAKDLLVAFGAPYVKIFGGGGGVIVHDEKRELENYGIDQIFHPDDGRRLGLEGMIQTIIQGCAFDILAAAEVKNTKSTESPREGVRRALASIDPSVLLTRQADRVRGIELTRLERAAAEAETAALKPRLHGRLPLIVGITGTGGAGKSSLVDEIVQRFLNSFPQVKLGIFCVDPSKQKTGGALLGDRIRMNSLGRSGTFMRSLASRGSGREVSQSLPRVLDWATHQDFDLIIAETSGIGQGNTAITEVSDVSLYVMTSEFGAQSQLEKIDMIDFADFIAINKADRRGAADALRDVRKQYRRSRKMFHEGADEALPVYLTQASHFNDRGVNELFFGLCDTLKLKGAEKFTLTPEAKVRVHASVEQRLIPPERMNYLATLVAAVRSYKRVTQDAARIASELGSLKKARDVLRKSGTALASPASDVDFENEIIDREKQLGPELLEQLSRWDEGRARYAGDEFTYAVRGKEIRQPLIYRSLSGLKIRRVVYPSLADWGDRTKFLRMENVPGRFPFTAGVFELKRTGEDPKRQFAGEGTPRRTNTRFHFLSKDDPAKRLSTAFDSVTLYGEDPAERPDIYGKVGESGVSICSLGDMKILYEGFDLCAPATSVSMTINGPAPMILAFFLNTAIDQQITFKENALGRKLNPLENQEVRAWTLQNVRGTVQADILKEDQAQNTCIFSLDFALKMMGDIQEYFIEQRVRNFYSVSISGYHIAEAGANPISQLAFTLSNGFTYVEYYLSRGMKIDDFAANLSFFFSNGLDPEYSVLGRVARRIWAIVLRDVYGAHALSQKLKYHIQTSGRSLHAQEIDFNDIRTTLQALLAVYDNCNSLHTNAYDEAITTPTEESVRRAMAIQMIINREFGMTKNENPTQGAYFIEELTELVEEAVLEEFLRINERGGVLGAMETQYQRSRIQDESLEYERLKHSGELPIIGVNTYINPKTMAADYVPPKIEMARATSAEKQTQLASRSQWKQDHADLAPAALARLQATALRGGNIFAELMDVARVCTLGEMSQALYEVGGQYRRSL